MQNEPLGRRLGKGAKREKEEAAALHTGGGRRWPVLLGCRRNASRSHFGGWGLHRQPQPRVTATGVACSELSQQLLKFLNPPRPSFNCLSSFLPHSSRLAHGCNPLSQNGYGRCFQEGRTTKRAHRLTSLHTIHRDGTKKKDENANYLSCCPTPYAESGQT